MPPADTSPMALALALSMVPLIWTPVWSILMLLAPTFSSIEVLEVILDHYADQGYQELEGRDILRLNKFEKFGGPVEIITNRFGSGEKYDKVIIEITKELYSKN